MDDDKPLPEKFAADLTRREWLLRLGEITALAGVAGLVPELATALTAAEQQTAVALPPGLYEPSSKHLIHALASHGPLTIPPGSETDYVSPQQGPFQPQFFSAAGFRVVTRIVEILLGNVNPDALDETARWLDRYLYSAAGVREAARRLDPLHRTLAIAYYGEARVVELETSDLQAVARAGLDGLEMRSREQFQGDFLQLDAASQAELLRQISQMPQETPLRRFYDLVRRETIRGYYTSRQGLKELDYKGNSYYSDCPGCELKSREGLR